MGHDRFSIVLLRELGRNWMWHSCWDPAGIKPTAIVCAGAPAMSFMWLQYCWLIIMCFNATASGSGSLSIQPFLCWSIGSHRGRQDQYFLSWILATVCGGGKRALMCGRLSKTAEFWLFGGIKRPLKLFLILFMRLDSQLFQVSRQVLLQACWVLSDWENSELCSSVLQAFELVAYAAEGPSWKEHGCLCLCVCVSDWRDLLVKGEDLLRHAESLCWEFLFPVFCVCSFGIRGDLADNLSHPFLAQKCGMCKKWH